ncbi:amino acid ABC transporter substrate-binding protein [Piscibacillus halophilus]|uniref:Amino acid ABC transporter substrate-binding protein, PAAT family n=1 Tax=Piscibacillus halophilus TaxID=571933 RepID=A0A1H9F7S2_9BACI|nr:amino acid ABC transporter substrate-binding protein [Piscibacillus halophilus]SEQ33982.1 amino acid ABC transporter substrate-binding protein, PAAT family [Piscibacillus halophilus]
MKKSMFLFLTIGLFVMFSACGSSGNLYEQIKEEGVITVGTEGTYPPFTFHNEEDELTGYDIEVITEVANRLDLEVDFKETQWDSMFAGLNAERFDVIANQVGIDEERQAKYDFSIPYTYSGAVVVVPEDNNDITSFEDIKGKKSAQSLTSNFGEIAEGHGAEIESVEGLAQSIELINQGRVDVTVNDKLAVLDYMNQKQDSTIKIAAEEENVSESAFMFNKGNEELVEAVNEQLEEMKEDGTLAEIAEKWFGEDVSSK